VFGIVDLTLAPVAAVLSRTGVIGMYPLSLVPLFVGPPMGILAHVYSIRNLLAARSLVLSEDSSMSPDRSVARDAALRPI
jgi:hypothetical protein